MDRETKLFGLGLLAFTFYIFGAAVRGDVQNHTRENLEKQKQEVIENFFYKSTMDSLEAARKMISLETSIDSLNNARFRTLYSWAEPYVD